MKYVVLKICKVLKVSSIVYKLKDITIIQGVACIVAVKSFLCHMFCGAWNKQQHYNEYLPVIWEITRSLVFLRIVVKSVKSKYTATEMLSHELMCRIQTSLK